MSYRGGPTMKGFDWLCVGVLATIVACGGDVAVMFGDDQGGGGDAGAGPGTGGTTGEGGTTVQSGPSTVTGQTTGQGGGTVTTVGQGGGTSGQGGGSSGQGGMTTGPTSGQGGGTATAVTATGVGGSGGMTTSSGQGGMSTATSSGQGGGSTTVTTVTTVAASSSASGGPNCPHDVCTNGPALDPMCGMCEATVCAADPFCCQAFWDGLCVQEAEQMCNIDCPTCPHDICSTGGFLDEECDPCAATVCMADITCCTQQWDGGCIQLVGSLCNIQCQ
jgi:hypothetical protein